MATHTLVEHQIEHGRKLVEALWNHGFEVTAAAWLKKSVNGRWSFYILSPAVETEGSRPAYFRLHALVLAMPQPFWIGFLDIRLLGTSEPIAKDVIAKISRMPGVWSGPIRWAGDNMVGNLAIEDAYLYRPPSPNPKPVAGLPAGHS